MYCLCSCHYRQKLIYWTEQMIPNGTREELIDFIMPMLKKLEKDLRIPNHVLPRTKEGKHHHQIIENHRI